MSACPNCGCPYTSGGGFATADIPHAWQDKDGTWYKGPARRTSTERCDGCGRTVSRTWERGKLTSEDVTHPGRPRRDTTPTNSENAGPSDSDSAVQSPRTSGALKETT